MRALGISIEQKSFYDILRGLAHKYDFEYPEDKLLKLAEAVKIVEMTRQNTPTGASAMISRPKNL